MRLPIAALLVGVGWGTHAAAQPPVAPVRTAAASVVPAPASADLYVRTILAALLVAR